MLRRAMAVFLAMATGISLLLSGAPPFSAMAANGGGTTYYVSTLGDDGNSGETPEQAWRTLGRVSSQTFGPGDRILLRGGDAWEGEYLALKGSGTANAPITLASYGEGRPRIVYAGSCLVMSNVSGWTVRGLELHNTHNVPMTGGGYITPTVSVSFTNSGVYHDLVFEENLIYGDSHDRNTRGITLMAAYPGREDEVAYNVAIRDNVIHDVGWDAVMVYGWDTLTNSNATTSALYSHVKVHGNTIYNTGNSGIILGTSNHSSIKWNRIYDNGIYTGAGNSLGSAGVVSIVTSYVDIMFNEVYNVRDSASGNDAEGIDVDWLTEFNTVMYNYCHDNMGPGLGTMSNTHTVMRYNRISGTEGLTEVGTGQITVTDFRVPSSRLTGVNFLDLSENLIFVDRPDTQAIATKAFSGGPWTNNYVSGNAVILAPGVSGTGVLNVGSGSAINNSNHNTVYSQSGTEFRAFRSGTAYHGLPSWRTATGWDLNTATVPVDTVPPSPPAGLTAAPSATAFAVELTWQAGGGGVHHYNIFRSTRSDFEPEYTNMVGETAGVSFTDTQELEGDATYYYRVNAEDRSGNWSGATAAAAARTGSSPATAPRTFKASGDFGVIAQGPVWRCQYWDGTDYSDILAFDNSWNAWRPGGTQLFVAAYSQMPEADRDSVRTFVAPFEGRITLERAGISLAAASAGDDGVRVKVLHNGVQVWPASGWQTVTYGAPALFPSLELDVQKGDSISFVVNRNQNIISDITIWDPIVTYNEVTLPPDLPVLPPPVDYGLPEPLTRELFRQTFDEGASDGFTPLTGSWSVASDGAGGALYRQSAAGTALSTAGESGWSEYAVFAEITPLTLGQGGYAGLGVLYRPDGSHYSVRLKQSGELAVVKVTQGTETLLEAAPCAVAPNQTYALSVSARRDGDSGGMAIEVLVNGRSLLRTVDTSSLITSGKAALCTFGGTADFDSIRVETYANAWVEALDVLLYDTFESGLTSLWSVREGLWSVVDDGGERLEQTGPAEASAVADIAPVQDVIAQTGVKLLTEEGAAGLSVRRTDGDNLLYAALYGTGRIALVRRTSGTDATLASKPFEVEAGVPYTVKVMADGGTVDLYVNGVKELTAADPAPAAGSLALVTLASGASFDDAVAQSLPSGVQPGFSSDFESGGMSGWSVLDGVWAVVDSTTKVLGQSGYGAALVSAGSGFEDFELRYRMRIRSTGSGDAYGNVCFKYTDINNMYYVHFNTYYGIALKKAVGGAYSELDVKPSFPVEIGRDYRVRIVASGSGITVYINGEKALSAKDSSIAAGGIAFWTINASVLYDDVLVTPVS